MPSTADIAKVRGAVNTVAQHCGTSSACGQQIAAVARNGLTTLRPLVVSVRRRGGTLAAATGVFLHEYRTHDVRAKFSLTARGRSVTLLQLAVRLRGELDAPAAPYACDETQARRLGAMPSQSARRALL